MRVEPDTGQNAEPDTGQTAYNPPSLATQRPEEDGLQERRKKKEARSSSTPTETALLTLQLKTEEEMAVEKELSTLQLEDTVNRLLPETPMHNFRQKPETEMRNDLSRREEPLAELKIEISQNSEHDVSERRNQKEKWETEADAKVDMTRHLPRHLDDATDAKVGQIQHSPRRKFHSSPRYVKNRSKDTENREETILLQRNDRPEGYRTSRQAKTCIWVEYRQHQISALIDTGSDVSLAGDKLTQELEWIIHTQYRSGQHCQQ